MRKVFYLLVFVLVAAGAFYGFKFYSKYSVIEAEIEKVPVEKGDIEVMFEDIGDIVPEVMNEVYSSVDGRVSELYVREGDTVRKGDKLAKIQPGQSEADKYVPVDVVSSVDGVILKCESRGYYEEGEIAKLGQRVSGVNGYDPTCLMRVANLDSLLVKIKVREVDVVKIKKGLPVKIYIDAVPNLRLTGKILLISPSAVMDRGGVKTFVIYAKINQRRLHLLPGMTARVIAVLEKRSNVLKIPLSALFEERGNYFVYLYDAKLNKAKKVNVKCGIRNDREVEILEGVRVGDMLYTEKPINVEENDKV